MVSLRSKQGCAIEYWSEAAKAKRRGSRGLWRPLAGSRCSAPVGGSGGGGRGPPETEAFYSSKIKLEPLGSTQIIKMDTNNWDTLDSLYNNTLFGNSDSCSPPIFTKHKWMNKIFGYNTFEYAPMNGQKRERIYSLLSREWAGSRFKSFHGAEGTFRGGITHGYGI